MAAVARSMQLDEPNIVLPLANSYNPRGMAAFTNNFDSALDQRKINVIYEPTVNSMSGHADLVVAKRPGTFESSGTYGDTDQISYLVAFKPGATDLSDGNCWVFSVKNNDLRASDTSGTNVIATAAGFFPSYVDKTRISGTETMVFQAKSAVNTQRVWYASAINSWTEITDSDFPTALAGKMEFMDGYAFAFATNGRIHWSDLNTLANWSANSYITKDIKQDTSLGLARLGKQIIAFGEYTMEVFVRTQGGGLTILQSVPDLFRSVGMASLTTQNQMSYYATIGDRIYFVGKSTPSARSLRVYSYDGARIEKVSTTFIEKILSSMALNVGQNETIYSVGAAEIYGQQCVVIALDEHATATQRCLVFCPEWKEWFEWNSTIWAPFTNGTQFLGNATQNKLYRFYSADGNRATDRFQDNATNYTYTLQFGLPKKGNAWERMHMFGVQGDTARSALNLAVSFSDDDGQTWSTARNIDMTSHEKRITRCGAYKTARQVRLSYTGSLDLRLKRALARVG